jgi:hypothetical protein
VVKEEYRAYYDDDNKIMYLMANQFPDDNRNWLTITRAQDQTLECQWLWLEKGQIVERKPTHNHYFSLKANGKDNGISTDSILQIIQKKKIATVFVKLNGKLTFQETKLAFDKFDCAKALNSSCLVPIRNVLNAPNSISKLSELLFFLETQNMIYSVFGLHLGNDYKGIKSYTTTEIQQRIEKLKRC